MNALRITLTSALLLGAPAALAQTGARPDPADPRLSVPAPATEPAFASYRGFRDAPPAPWREVNDEVRRPGGQAGQVSDAAKPADRDEAKPAAMGGPKHGH